MNGTESWRETWLWPFLVWWQSTYGTVSQAGLTPWCGLVRSLESTNGERFGFDYFQSGGSPHMALVPRLDLFAHNFYGCCEIWFIQFWKKMNVCEARMAMVVFVTWRSLQTKRNFAKCFFVETNLLEPQSICELRSCCIIHLHSS